MKENESIIRLYNKLYQACKMHEVGLHPSTTGFEGGKETGVQCSHYIEEGGEFEKFWERLKATGFKLDLESVVFPEKDKAPKSKFKYECPGDCGQKLWGKPKLDIKCNVCKKNFICTDEDAEEEED